MKQALVSFVAVMLVAAGFSGCYSEHEAAIGGNPPGGGSGGARTDLDASVAPPDRQAPPSPPGPDGPSNVISCKPARAGEKLPARTAVMSAPVPQKRTMLVGELFSEFDTNCGGCHVDLGNGDYRVARATFADDISKNMLGDDIGRAAIERIYDEAEPMPPDIAAPSTRDPKTDPYLRLGVLLEAWFDQGKPRDIFEPPQGDVTTPPTGQPYQLTTAVGEALTNLGNCVPDRLALSEEGDALDERFRKADRLPQSLTETDLTSLDSAVLAGHGVVAYAPAYPLWSDNAHKMRHLRLPRGESIAFDKATQSFRIPENTRFYKTFSRKVVERGGQERYRKIETRIIVTRAPEVVNGEVVQRALFGTYEWNDDETEALLNELPRIDGTPFADHLFPYVVDEAKEEAVLAAHQPNGDLTRELQNAGAIRHYAVPGSERCVRCHMGSPTESFVLGFLPLQVKWRPEGEGGVIDAPQEDELNQLQRLIDYGVITGMDGPDDVLGLEDSQGDRKPRNDQELVAQGYLLGNCAHCHNPLGFPSVQNPEIKDLLNFLPGDGPDEGVFQFPLERYSPRIGRGIGGITKMPYITPSLVDFPSTADYNRTASYDGLSSADTFFRPEYMAVAPWRSLIYRNVDTPFPYSVDVALFPHMPMDTPGFDCRAPRILGEWMVSIPATRKSRFVEETLVQATIPVNSLFSNEFTDRNEQPYREVLPGEKGYETAAEEALARLGVYRTGEVDRRVLSPIPPSQQPPRFYSRYQYCPDTSDIVDPSVTGGDKLHLVPGDLRYVQGKDLEGKDKVLKVPMDYDVVAVRGQRGKWSEDLEPVLSTDPIVWPDDGVPDRAHWVNVQTGEPPGEWAPRRSDWKKYLVEHRPPDSPFKTPEEKAAEALALSIIDTAKFTPAITETASRAVPFGLWKSKPECDAKFTQANVKKISDLTGELPLWVSANEDAVPDARVYSMLPGAAVYNMVCVNCHGARADSRGRQAETLQFMTGGDARVANFINGLFGPAASPGGNRQRVFDAGQGATPDDWGARYLAWMALGGTEKLIPRGILNVVSVTPVLGQVRRFEGANSANMLGPVQFLCGELHTYRNRPRETRLDPGAPFQVWLDDPPGNKLGNYVWDQLVKNSQLGDVFLKTTGDPELWASLCSVENPMPVRIIDFLASNESYRGREVDRVHYPASARIGNHRGHVETGVAATNLLPWCVRPFPDQDTYTTGDNEALPICPPEILAADKLLTNADIERWSYKGAVNTGFAVFHYLDALAKGLTPVPAYDRCEELK